MGSLGIAIVVLGCVFTGALLGLRLGNRLPDHYRGDDSRDVVKLTVGIIATLSALVLGLLVSSAKDTYDALDHTVKTSAAKLMLLDQALSRYGRETAPLRHDLRDAVETSIRSIMPGTDGLPPRGNVQVGTRLGSIQQGVLTLEPKSRSQELLQSRALQLLDDLMQARLLAIEQMTQPVKPLFLAILVLWLMFVFAGFGFLAPHNWTAVVALMVGSFSVAGAIFLIVEMGSTPVSGWIAISIDPLRNALSAISTGTPG